MTLLSAILLIIAILLVVSGVLNIVRGAVIWGIALIVIGLIVYPVIARIVA